MLVKSIDAVIIDTIILVLITFFVIFYLAIVSVPHSHFVDWFGQCAVVFIATMSGYSRYNCIFFIWFCFSEILYHIEQQ
jgi:hypothetical protein